MGWKQKFLCKLDTFQLSGG